MNTAGRCRCANQERRSPYPREKENVSSNPHSKSYSAVHRTMIDKNNGTVVRQKVLAPEYTALNNVTRTAQNTSRRSNCGCSSYQSRVPLTDLKGQYSKCGQSKRYPEPPVSNRTLIKTVPTLKNTTYNKGAPSSSSTLRPNQTNYLKTASPAAGSLCRGACNANSTVKSNSNIFKATPAVRVVPKGAPSASSTVKPALKPIKATQGIAVSPASKATSRSLTFDLSTSSSSKTVRTNPFARGPSASSTLIANTTCNLSPISLTIIPNSSLNKSANSTASTTIVANISANSSASTTLVPNKSSSSASSKLSSESRNKSRSSTGSSTLLNKSSINSSDFDASSTIVSINSSLNSSFGGSFEEKGTVVPNNLNSSKFWQTFKTVKSSTKVPYKIKRHIPVYTEKALERGVLIVDRSIYDGIPCLKKKTLKKHLILPSTFLGVANLDSHTNKVHPKFLYQLDIIEDVIHNITNQQKINILRFEFLQENDQLSEYRSAIVNWLVKLHHFLAPDTNVFFVAIRLFDKLLENGKVPQTKYQLVALLTYWISLKYNNSVKFITAPNLLKLCGNRYDLDLLLQTEREVLILLNFGIAVDDPMIFVYYFIYIMQTSNSTMISFCANYFLEILALGHNCNCYPLSLQAASAVFLALKMLGYGDSYWQKVRDFSCYHEEKEMYDIHKIILEFVINMSDENFPFRESYKKYSTEKYEKVSLNVSSLLDNI